MSLLWLGFGKKVGQPFPFQIETWETYLAGYHGLVNAPTGSGKTYSLLLPILLEHLQNPSQEKGLRAIWITPIRALAKEIQAASQRAIQGLGLEWKAEIRSGDTSSSERQKQKKNPPELLITTPESLHLLLAAKEYPKFFKHLQVVVVDEWHELVGSKRGVQIELALAHLKGILPTLKIWGISATIGNMDEALAILLGGSLQMGKHKIVRANIKKNILVESILPDEIEKFPWSGHLGIKLLEKILPIIAQSKTTLIFTNTRAQCEIWYQNLLEVEPDLSGQIAMHHSSISQELRDWVETSLHEGLLKAVVCTSSLDLGVDFRPVETIIQIGSPKGVARFLQRAGRSGHQPGAVSKIYFLPTNSLELIEASALRTAIAENEIEARLPYLRSFDVLLQFLVTLAVSDGFLSEKILDEVKQTLSYQSISLTEWQWCLSFIKDGGSSLSAYDEYRKVEQDESGTYKVTSKKIAMRHRLSIGTIMSEAALRVTYVSGGHLGTIEEWFVGQLKPGDVFWFAGKSLEFVRIKDMTVQVRKSSKTKGKVPAWLGGKLMLSSELSHHFRAKIDLMAQGIYNDEELKKLQPLMELQAKRSHIPRSEELLIESFSSKEGHHVMIYPFEGRAVHEGLSAVVAHRIAQIKPISFSIAMNDYGFELLSDQEIPLDQALKNGLFSTQQLSQDIQKSINATELAKRRFRDIASIAGLVFKGYPGEQKKERHLQASSQLFFQVFHDYEPNNLLLQQAYEEVMTFQLQEARLRQVLERIQHQTITQSNPKKATPFAFPIITDRLRERLSSEKLEDRIQKMKLQLLKD
ncbi:MAG: ligase-associated DNA damage response DEXH box helicase [Saprospiraceae bacterium]|nr:ligase-associated DNA damage response DEXH box helicase [Saprospiraceae bacterium]